MMWPSRITRVPGGTDTQQVGAGVAVARLALAVAAVGGAVVHRVAEGATGRSPGRRRPARTLAAAAAVAAVRAARAGSWAHAGTTCSPCRRWPPSTLI